MQDKLYRLVSVLFFGLVIFLVFGLVGIKTGQPGVTFSLGLILFGLVIASQFTVNIGKSSGKAQSVLVREFFAQNRAALIGGLIIVAVLLSIALIVPMVASR